MRDGSMVSRRCCVALAAGLGAAWSEPAVVGRNGQHRSVRPSTVEEDSDFLARFQHRAGMDDLLLAVGDDAVAARQHRPRVEVRQAGSQAAQVGRPAIERPPRRPLKSRRQRLQMERLPRHSGALLSQPMPEVGQRSARPCAAQQQAGVEAALQVSQPLLLAREQLPRVLQAARQPVELLCALVDELCGPALQGESIGGEARVQRAALGAASSAAAVGVGAR
jgi:hypothetical protein